MSLNNIIGFLLTLAITCFGQINTLDSDAESLNRTTRQSFEDWYYGPYNLGSYPMSYYSDPYYGEVGSLDSKYSNQYYPYFRGGLNDDGLAQGRLSSLGAAALGSFFASTPFGSSPVRRFRPFASLASLLPFTFSPSSSRLFSTLESCTSPTGETGFCTAGSVCSTFGGRPSGTCSLARVCCINVISKCDATTTLNNTYWLSPTTGVIPTSCSLDIKLDTQLLEQTKATCQIRLDFTTFEIAQPATSSPATATVCSTDSFEVIGATNTVPTICGENKDQHMYLHVSSSDTNPSVIKLVFKFGATSIVTRSWKIKISMLPCGASYLAPNDCLQYITTSSGSVKSFNYADVASSVRQLAEQDYYICFREELISGRKASSICLSKCSGTTLFRLSATTASSGGRALQGTDCRNDFVIFNGGTTGAALSDRFCGENFSATSASVGPDPVCTTVKPFKLYYRTDRGELASPTENSVGFCLDFNQS